MNARNVSFAKSPADSMAVANCNLLRRVMGFSVPARWLIAVLVLAIALFFLMPTIADPDLWGHLRFGTDFLDSGTLARSDPYSYLTGDQPWINHEWLFDVVVALLFRVGGPAGLITLKVTITLGLVAFLYRDLWRNGLSVLPGGFVILLTAFLLSIGATIRAQLFTYVLFVLLVWLLREAERGRMRLLGLVPALFVPWVNVHGGFIVGMAVLVCWSGVHVVRSAFRTRSRRMRGERWWIGIAIVGSLLAALINPYGYTLLAFLFQPATFSRPEITEWQPLRLATIHGMTYLVAVVLALVGVARSKRPFTATTLVGFGCLVAPLLAYRHTPLFAVALPVLFGGHIASAWNDVVSREDGLARRRADGRIILAGCMMLATLAPAMRIFGCINMDQPGAIYPERAVGLLRDSRVSGSLAVWFDWGEYVIWHLGPRVKVSVDGRRETVYSDRQYRRNWDFALGLGAWDSLPKESRTTMALVSTAMPVFNLMRLTPGWSLVYQDEMSALFVRVGTPAAERLRGATPPSTPADGRSCFPG